MFDPIKIKEILDNQVEIFNSPSFISKDPISIPHAFTGKEDIEISGFLAATFAMGKRITIINKSRDLLNRMDNAPFDFVMNAQDNEFRKIESFIHRTFQGDDGLYFIEALRRIYTEYGGLEQVFLDGYMLNNSIKEAIMNFRKIFLSFPHLHRTEKHIANPEKGSAAKRLNMFLRWMVRVDDKGVDFGIWKHISPASLYCPLDVHSANISRQLGLLKNKNNNWNAVEELTSVLRTFDSNDPVKYDFALFSIGVEGKIL